MSSSEPNLAANGSSWLPYMCPNCRGLFRSERTHSGPCSCPLCEAPLSIKEVEDDELAEEESTLPQPLERGERHHEESVEQSWDDKNSRGAPVPGSQGLILTTVFLLSLAAAVGIFFVAQARKEKENTRKSLARQGLEPDRFDAFQFDNVPANDTTNEPLLQLATSDIERAYTATEIFLSCPTIEDFANLIRQPERVMPLLREYYQRVPYEIDEALTIDEQGTTRVAKQIASFQVVLKSYETRLIAVELEGEKALIDWESWVAHCEEPWEDFITNRTKEDKMMRMQVSRSFYYNFDFNDDQKWVCFKLTRSADESILYGYVPVDSPFLSQLPTSHNANASFRLDIRFPDQTTTDNQVLITDVIGSGWVNGL